MESIGGGFQALEFGGNGAHWDQLGAGDARGLKLRRLAYIDEREPLACVDAAFTSWGVISSGSAWDMLFEGIARGEARSQSESRGFDSCENG